MKIKLTITRKDPLEKLHDKALKGKIKEEKLRKEFSKINWKDYKADIISELSYRDFTQVHYIKTNEHDYYVDDKKAGKQMFWKVFLDSVGECSKRFFTSILTFYYSDASNTISHTGPGLFSCIEYLRMYIPSDESKEKREELAKIFIDNFQDEITSGFQMKLVLLIYLFTPSLRPQAREGIRKLVNHSGSQLLMEAISGSFGIWPLIYGKEELCLKDFLDEKQILSLKEESKTSLCNLNYECPVEIEYKLKNRIPEILKNCNL